MRLKRQNISSAVKNIPSERFPNHVLIIPDGNGRWAKKFHKIPAFGHQHCFKILQKVIRNLQSLPINILTIWAFSSDNWKRSDQEIKALLQIIEAGIKEATAEMFEKDIRFICLGRRDKITQSLKRAIEDGENQTKNLGPKIFCVAIDFSGQDQEIRMMQKILKLPKNTKVDIDLIKSLRDSGGLIPPADFIVRTSGEQRTSDLGWLSQNSEFYAIKKYLPETTPDDFLLALIDYSKRERRFGGRFK